MSSEWNTLLAQGFISSIGVCFRAIEVPAVGDCAIHAVLCSIADPPFLSHELCRQEVFQWAGSEGRTLCSLLYQTYWRTGTESFEQFLDSARKPRFWVGTIFFDFFYALTGIDVMSFEPDGNLAAQASRRVHLLLHELHPDDPIIRHIAKHRATNCQTAFVLFHQFRHPLTVLRDLQRRLYNHFGALVPQYVIGEPAPIKAESIDLTVSDGVKLVQEDLPFEPSIGSWETFSGLPIIGERLNESHKSTSRVMPIDFQI